jgi:hypothetical protein
LESLYALGTSHTPSWLLHKKRLQDIQFGFYAQKHVKKQNMLDGKKQQE